MRAPSPTVLAQQTFDQAVTNHMERLSKQTADNGIPSRNARRGSQQQNLLTKVLEQESTFRKDESESPSRLEYPITGAKLDNDYCLEPFRAASLEHSETAPA